jgi:L-fucose mutarotase
MMKTGHGEELLICDGNYPSLSARGEKIYTPCGDIAELLKAVLYFFPLDYASEYAAVVMESCREGEAFGKYTQLIEENKSKLECAERFAFYKRAENAVYIIVTADTTKGGNILLKKGVVKDADLPKL